MKPRSELVGIYSTLFAGATAVEGRRPGGRGRGARVGGRGTSGRGSARSGACPRSGRDISAVSLQIMKWFELFLNTVKVCKYI